MYRLRLGLCLPNNLTKKKKRGRNDKPPSFLLLFLTSCSSWVLQLPRRYAKGSVEREDCDYQAVKWRWFAGLPCVSRHSVRESVSLPVRQRNEVGGSGWEMTSWSGRPRSNRADVSLRQSMPPRDALRAKWSRLAVSECGGSRGGVIWQGLRRHCGYAEWALILDMVVKRTWGPDSRSARGAKLFRGRKSTSHIVSLQDEGRKNVTYITCIGRRARLGWYENNA